MLPKKYRLSPQEIARIARRGKRFSHELFSVRVWYDSSYNEPQCAFAVSTKVHKSAVVRNRIKRKFRSAVMQVIQEGKLRPAHYFFIAHNATLEDVKVDELAKLLLILLR